MDVTLNQQEARKLTSDEFATFHEFTDEQCNSIKCEVKEKIHSKLDQDIAKVKELSSSDCRLFLVSTLGFIDNKRGKKYTLDELELLQLLIEVVKRRSKAIASSPGALANKFVRSAVGASTGDSITTRASSSGSSSDNDNHTLNASDNEGERAPKRRRPG